MIRKNTHGAEWKKWDLHIHTPASDGAGTPEEIVDKAIEKGLSVIAITDHHTADYIDLVKEAAKDKELTVLSGIEFRSEYGSKSVHFIGYFPEKYENTELNAAALNELILCPLELSRTAIIAKGREQAPSLDDNAAFKKGMFLVQVDLKKASDLIHKYGGFISVHNGSKSNGLDAEVRHEGTGPRNVSLYESLGTLKDELLKNYVDICDVGKDKDTSFYLENFNLPSILTSDAHSFDEIGSRFTWIKAETSFEGLKQIIYEPEARVRIQDIKPEEKPSYQLINSITFNHKDFTKEPIYLNPNLNTIIGGRSSGKSILLGCIAKKTDNSVVVKERINGELSAHDKYINEICKNIEIEWNDKQPDNEHKIEYYGQSVINSYASDSKKVDSIVQRIINKEDEKRNALEKYNIFQINNQKDITNKIAELIDLREKELAVDEQIKGIGNKQGLEDEIAKLKKDISEINKSREGSFTEESLNKFGESVEQMHNLEGKLSSWEKDLNILSLLKEKELVMPISGEVAKISDGIKESVLKIYEEITSNVKKIWFDSIESLEKDVTQAIDNCRKDISAITTSPLYAKGLEYLKENEAYANKTQLLKDEENKLRQILDFEKEKENLHKNYLELFDTIISLNSKYFSETKKLAELIKQKKGDVEISAKSVFTSDKIITTLEKSLNKTFGEGKKLKEFKGKNQDEIEAYFKNLLTNIDNGGVKLTKDTSLQTVLTTLMAINYYSISYKVKYENDDLESMSEGKKAFIILRLLLDFDESVWPILIDQPEDDLDNRAIYTDLVSYLRDKKTKRQIILVTHNPNIVVGADSELVIVANRHGSKNENPDKIKFCYYGDTLESSFKDDEEKTVLYKQGIKEHICEILEGGDAAFKLREKKYGYDK